VKLVKHKTIISLVVILGIVFFGAVYASGQRGSSGVSTCQNVDIEKVKQFQKETMSLRDDLMIKKLELRKEYKQPAPDSDRIKTLKQEMRDLQASIREAANKAGVDLRCVKRRHREEGKGGNLKENKSVEGVSQ
jgi:cell shape-determining protein MreC